MPPPHRRPIAPGSRSSALPRLVALMPEGGQAVPSSACSPASVSWTELRWVLTSPRTWITSAWSGSQTPMSRTLRSRSSRAIRAAVPNAEICFDPFHVVCLARVPSTRSAATSATPTNARTPRTGVGSRAPAGHCSRHPSTRAIHQPATLAEVQPHNRRLYRAFLLREELRLLYHLEDPGAGARPPGRLAGLGRPLTAHAVRRLARTLRRHRDGILAAIRLGLSNGRLEGLNSRDPPHQPPRFGFHSAAPLIALVYLCCSGITIDLPR